MRLPDSADTADRDPPGDAPRLQVRLLGAFEVHFGPRAQRDWPSRAAQLLLARLALWPGRQHAREELVELLWPGVDVDVGRNRLRQALATLRDTLRELGAGEPVVGDRQVLRLAAERPWCDALALRDALRAGNAARVRALDRGMLLPGHYDEWVLEERQSLAAALERFVARGDAEPTPARRAAAARAAPASTLPVYLTQLHGAEAQVDALHQAIAVHRLLLLRGPGGVGKTRLAVEAAQRLADAGRPFELVCFVPLAACETREAMGEAILQALHGGGGGGVAGSPAGETRQRVRDALEGRHVLLLLDNLEQLVERGRNDLAWWLAHLPHLHVLLTSRRATGLDGEHEMLVSSLALPPPDADLAELARSPAVALLADRARAARSGFAPDAAAWRDMAAISRQLHGLPLAIELAAGRLRGLGLAELRALFEQPVEGRAAATASAQAEDIADVCAPPPRLALLSRSGPRSADDPRHASMLTVAQWSLQHLADDERAVLAALVVFDAGATLDAAVQVAAMPTGRVAEALQELVASSVVFLREGRGDTARYHVFEPVRDVLLWQTDAPTLQRLQRRHLEWLSHWSAGAIEADTVFALLDELPNLSAGWRRASGSTDASVRTLAVDVALQLHLVLADIVLPLEALDQLHALGEGLAAPAEPSPVATLRRARLAALLAEQRFEQGQRDAARQCAEAALAGLRSAQSASAASGSTAPTGLPAQHLALTLFAVARIRLRVDDDPGAEALNDEALALVAAPPSERAVAGAAAGAVAIADAAVEAGRVHARCLSLESVLCIRLHHDPQGKLAVDQQALALWRQHGPAPRVAEGLVNVALALGFLHRVPEQLALLEQARSRATASGQSRLLAFVCSVRGYALADLRRWHESVASYRECLVLACGHSAWREWFYALWNLPRSLAHLRDARRAGLLMAFADRFGHERFGRLGASDLRELRRSRRLLRHLLGAGALDALWPQGRALDMAQAMRLAMGEAVGEAVGETQPVPAPQTAPADSGL